MIVSFDGLLVDSSAGVVTPDLLKEWVSNPKTCHKVKEVINHFDEEYRELGDRLQVYVTAYALAPESVQSVFPLTPVGLVTWGCYYPLVIHYDPDSSLAAYRSFFGNTDIQIVPYNGQYEWEEAASFESALVARMLFPPKGLCRYSSGQEFSLLAEGVGRMAASFHAIWHTWKVLTSSFPTSSFHWAEGTLFQTFGWVSPPKQEPQIASMTLLSLSDVREQQLADYQKQTRGALSSSKGSE